MSVLVDKVGRELLLGTAAWGFLAGSQATVPVVTPPSGTINNAFPLLFTGKAGSQPSGSSSLTYPFGTASGSALDGSGHYVLQPNAGFGMFAALGSVPDGAYTVTLAAPGKIAFVFRGSIANDQINSYYTGPSGNGNYSLNTVANNAFARYVSETTPCPLASAWTLVIDGAATSVQADGVEIFSSSSTDRLADGQIGIKPYDGYGVAVSVASFDYLSAAQAEAIYAAAHPAPTTAAHTLTFTGPAGAPPTTGVEALTLTPGATASIAGTVLTGAGALNLGTTEFTDLTLSGVGPVGNGTFTATYAAGTPDKQVRIMFGVYTWQVSGSHVELWGPDGNVCVLSLTPSTSLGVSVQNGVALCLVDGAVAYILRRARTALWGPLRIGTVVYPGNCLIDSYTVDPNPLPMPVLAPSPVTLRQVSTSVPIGFLVGNALVATVGPTQVVQAPGNLQSYAITGPDASLFFMRGDGVLTTLQPLVLGDKQINVVTTDNASGLSRTDAVTIQVPQGNAILAGSAGSVKLTIPQNITNNPMSPLVGTPTCTGVTGTKVWTLSNKDYHIGVFGNIFHQIVADSVTGTVQFYQQAAARADGHTFILSCSDGINTATETFNVPVAWFVGPKVYLGPGDATSHPGFDRYFKHITDIEPLIGNSYNLPDPSMAGAVITTDDGGSDTYFANDFNPNEERWMFHGPLKFKNIGGPNGRRVRWGGDPAGYGGGIARGDKSFTLLNGGDILFDGFRWSHGIGDLRPDDPSGGRTALRMNDGVNGDLTLLNCQIDNSSNGLETGDGPNRITIKNSIFFNNGGATQGSGQTHACYLNGAELIYQNNVSFNNNVGHCLKTRCGRGTITDSVLGDGATGSCSSPLNIPQLGDYLVTRNVFHKGPSHQNAAVIGYGEDDYGRDRHDLLNVVDNIFYIVTVAGVHNGNGIGIKAWSRQSSLDGAFSNILVDQNKWFLSDPANQVKFLVYANPGAPTVTETNSTDLVSPPVLNFADPGTANPPAENPGAYNYLFYYGGGDYANMDGVQICSSVKDIRVSAAAPSGTVLTTMSPYGANLWKTYGIPNDIRVNPFVAGSTWQITQDPEWYGYPAGVWAPPGRYQVVPSSDGTSATLQVGTGLVANKADVVKVRVTAPNGTLVDWRFPISVAA